MDGVRGKRPSDSDNLRHASAASLGEHDERYVSAEESSRRCYLWHARGDGAGAAKGGRRGIWSVPFWSRGEV